MRSLQDGYTLRDQVLCDLLHVFDVTLRTYKPLQLADTPAQTPGEPCACKAEPPCSCAPAARLKLSHLQTDAQVRSLSSCILKLPCLLSMAAKPSEQHWNMNDFHQSPPHDMEVPDQLTNSGVPAM